MKRILVVDDEPIVRQLCCRMLAHQGYEALEAGSAREALILVARQAPDLVLLDCSMPGVDGSEVLRVLKSEPSTWNIPVVMLTGMGAPSDLARFAVWGADGHLGRPFDRQELLLLVGRLLTQYPPARRAAAIAHPVSGVAAS